MTFENKSVFISGAATGIGRGVMGAIAAQLGERVAPVREDGAGAFTACAVAYERWQQSLQAQPNGSSVACGALLPAGGL